VYSTDFICTPIQSSPWLRHEIKPVSLALLKYHAVTFSTVKIEVAFAYLYRVAQKVSHYEMIKNRIKSH